MPAPARTTYHCLRARELSSVTLPAHRAKPTAARAQPSTTGRLAPDPVEHPAADLGGDDEADEEVQQDRAGLLDAVLPRAIWAYSLAKKKTGTNASMAMPSTRFSTRKGRIREDAAPR